MKITIVYDNTAWQSNLIPDWGFSCLVETPGRNILFDTGARGDILVHNLDVLGISPQTIDMVFISHAHWDHTGGLKDFLQRHATAVCLPSTCPTPRNATEVFAVHKPLEIFEDIYSTGELAGIEQSLVIRQQGHAIVVAGCSHPGVGTILDAAGRIAPVKTLIGGLHGFSDFHLIERLDAVCPAHCTRYTEAIRQMHPERFIAPGAGKVIEIGSDLQMENKVGV